MSVEDDADYMNEEDDEEKQDVRETIEEEGEDDIDKNEEQEPNNPLTKDIISECLTMISQIGSGLNYSFIKLDCSERDITDISILKQYINLRLINLSKNLIKDISPLSSMTNLMMLNLEANMLDTGSLDSLDYLQILNLSSNNIISLDGIRHPTLEWLSIGNNQISETIGPYGAILDKSILTRLHTLDLHGNKLTSTAGFDLPNLKVLYLASNSITKIEGLNNLISLTTLHMRDNKIENLDGFTSDLVSLQSINLRTNGVVKAREVRKLQCLPSLKALTLLDNPAAEDEDYRMEVLAYLRKLVKLDKDEFEEEEREEAEAVLQQKLIDEKEEIEAAALLKAEEAEVEPEDENLEEGEDKQLKPEDESENEPEVEEADEDDN